MTKRVKMPKELREALSKVAMDNIKDTKEDCGCDIMDTPEYAFVIFNEGSEANFRTAMTKEDIATYLREEAPFGSKAVIFQRNCILELELPVVETKFAGPFDDMMDM